MLPQEIPSDIPRTKFVQGMALEKRSNNPIGLLRDRVRWYSSSYELCPVTFYHLYAGKNWDLLSSGY